MSCEHDPDFLIGELRRIVESRDAEIDRLRASSGSTLAWAGFGKQLLAEIDRLRARVAELEAELAAVLDVGNTLYPVATEVLGALKAYRDRLGELGCEPWIDLGLIDRLEAELDQIGPSRPDGRSVAPPWTTEKPKEPGWYWLRTRDYWGQKIPQVVHVQRNEFGHLFAGWNLLPDRAEWAGPLPEPGSSRPAAIEWAIGRRPESGQMSVRRRLGAISEAEARERLEDYRRRFVERGESEDGRIWREGIAAQMNLYWRLAPPEPEPWRPAAPAGGDR